MFRYSLHKEKKKQPCPICQKKRFVRYIDKETGEILPNIIGRCDREINCGYHLTPKAFFLENNLDFIPHTIPKVKQEVKPPNFHSSKLVMDSNKSFKQNSFVQFLEVIFSKKQVNKIVSSYFIGTSNHWKGSTIFWQIDKNNSVRGGKIMLYSPLTGKRIKTPYNHITWVHSVLLKKRKINEFNLSQCLFGLHLINNELHKPIAIVESEKTACIMSVEFDKYIWLACGSLSNINERIFNPIKNRKIVLYPDLSKNKRAFNKWKIKSDELSKIGFRITISNLLEEYCSEDQKENGLDISDFFISRKT